MKNKPIKNVQDLISYAIKSNTDEKKKEKTATFEDLKESVRRAFDMYKNLNQQEIISLNIELIIPQKLRDEDIELILEDIRSYLRNLE